MSQTELKLENLPRTIALVRAGFSSFEELPLTEFGAPVMNRAAFEAYQAFVSENFVPAGIPVCVIIDQRQLPLAEQYLCTCDWRDVMEWIKVLAVRGAPAIGIAGACAVTLRAYEYTYAQGDNHRFDGNDFDRVFIIDEQSFDPALYKIGMQFAGKMIKKVRPTAVNLAWAVDKCVALAENLCDSGAGTLDIAFKLFDLTVQLSNEDEAANRKMGQFGASLLGEGSTLLTHCNAGSLATTFYGTALGVVYAAAEQGKVERVYADETRPVGQGARLTAWELAQAGIDVTLICDNMAASVMAQGKIDAIFVGADRVAANGDVANKIGTLSVAIAAKHFNIPFYVVAPSSSVDLNIADGAQIPIEQRASTEVCATLVNDHMCVYNPAFDVTPANLVTAIITEFGIFKPEEISKLKTYI